MAWIIETPNSFQPLTNLKRHYHSGGITIRKWLEIEKPGFVEFTDPTICLVNGQPVLRADWTTRIIQEDDIVNFITVVGAVPLLIITAVLLIASVALALAMPMPTTPGELPTSDPVFSAKGKVNDNRLGQPIEVPYGRNRIYPSLASRPFYRYFSNDQYQYSLLCIGQGKYEIHEVRIGESPITSYQEVQYEIIEPGGTPTLFRTNVITSAEAGGQTLYGWNEPEFPGTFTGPFTVNPPGTTVDRIEIDLVYPRGIYSANKDGGLDIETIYTEFYYRKIDDAGNPLSGWGLLFFNAAVGATTTPWRQTRGVPMPVGRYEVKGWRWGTREVEATRGNEVVWDGMRGFIVGGEPDYGDVTLLAVRVKASNNLNSRTMERFNVIATRKLPIRESGGTWSEPITTRSIIWALVDVFRSNYGGQLEDDHFFDWDALYALDALYESRGEYFDWVFRDPITVWEAAKTIARVGRAIPMLLGSLITVKRNGPLEMPVTMFTPENIVGGTFQWDIRLWEPEDYDSLQIEYTDPDTGYQQEQVLCVLPGSDSSAGSRPKDLRIPGIQDRNHAYREGLFILASELYLRENISFQTGMEGMIPSYGDLVAISHDVPRWGQSGYVLAVEEASALVYHLRVSEPLVFESDGEHVILLRRKDGGLLGPYTVIEGSDPQSITIEADTEIDFLTTGETEPMLFLFGVSGAITKYGRVVKIEPQGGEIVKITLVNEDSRVHSLDELTAPPLQTPSLPPVVPDLPEVTSLTLSRVPGTQIVIQASWSAAFGAQYYIVESSADGGETWNPRGQTTRTSIQFQSQPGTILVRVAAVNSGQGPWKQGSIDVGLVSGLAIDPDWEALEWGARWWERIDIDSWEVKVYDNLHSEPILKRTEILSKTTVSYLYDYTMALADGNLTREMLVAVDVRVRRESTGEIEASGYPSYLSLSNALPAAPYHLGWEALGADSDGNPSFRLTWENPAEDDTHRIRIWASESSIFDPDDTGALVYEFTAGSPGSTGLPEEAVVSIPVSGSGVIYWWVGIMDVWGDEAEIDDSTPGNVASGVPIELPWILTTGSWDDIGRWDDDETWRDS